MICGDMVGIEVRTSAALTEAVSNPSDHSEPPACWSTSPIGSWANAGTATSPAASMAAANRPVRTIDGQ